ncbi:MAG: type I-C CRISPR-associated protein Cas5c [Planctomycetota bacterium]|nr:type I-C CRISPR-associated protein Cas5c [Planctomycetota bacterium]
MNQRSPSVSLHVSGCFALFTRPEMKVERVSYDVITPSAARGVLEAILWKPQMRWLIRRITVLNPVRFSSFKRNEVASKIPSTFRTWARENKGGDGFYADADRAQRNAVLLRDVAYVVDAEIELTDKASPDDNLNKYTEMFTRRVEKGQQFHQPYLGCREFPAAVRPTDGSEHPHKDLLGEHDLGWMLNDIVYDDGKPVEPRFFRAVMRDGVIDVPALEAEGVAA